MTKKLITDNPKMAGYVHGLKFEERRETSEKSQQADYEKWYRKGVKDGYKIERDLDEKLEKMKKKKIR